MSIRAGNMYTGIGVLRDYFGVWLALFFCMRRDYVAVACVLEAVCRDVCTILQAGMPAFCRTSSSVRNNNLYAQ